MYEAKSDRYDHMLYRRCGRSGIKLPGVSLGFWHNFGGVTTFENAKQIMLSAFDMGVTHFDLANNYGPPAGAAEENFGRVITRELAAHRDELVISTKAGYLMWPGPYGDHGSRKYLLASLDASLKRMKLDYVDIFYHHRPDPETPLEESMGALATAVAQGKALYVGLSNYKADDAARAIDLLAGMGVRCLICQPRYNMFDRWVENGLYSVLREKGVGAIPFSPLAQGLLTERYLNGIPADSRAAGGSVFLKPEAITEDYLAKAVKLKAIADERGQSLAQMALAWLLRDSVTASVLVGASKPSQLAENVRALDKLAFAPDELEAIDDILQNG